MFVVGALEHEIVHFNGRDEATDSGPRADGVQDGCRYHVIRFAKGSGFTVQGLKHGPSLPYRHVPRTHRLWMAESTLAVV